MSSNSQDDPTRLSAHRSMSDDLHNTNPILSARHGFSLLELLLVISVAGILAALIVPAAAGLTSVAERRGAVESLMGALEQARVAAIESRQHVYVGFADADFPVQEMRFAAWIVFRDASEDEMAASPSKRFVVLQKWTRLPKNMAFMRGEASFLGGAPMEFQGLESEVGASQADEAFPAVAFNPAGAVEQPASPLRVLLYKGYFAEGRDNSLSGRATRDRAVDQISLSRFTGRAQFDIAASGN